MISVKELTKRYARNTAVDQISFEVEKGQIVGFLGPNGAGKTTTMRILTCFLPPSAGTAKVAGFDVLEQPLEVKKRIGYLPETPPIYPEMETDEYLKFVGKLKGLRGADLQKRVDYVCDRCAVADSKTKLLGKLSKGYRQRVGLAQAIIHNPDVLILDEPTAGLDPKQINETRDLIKDLAGDHTIILSTHILPEVEQTCQQVIIINKGKLVATDSVRNLQARARGAESVLVEVAGRTGRLEVSIVEHKLQQVSGVSRVVCKEQIDSRALFEVESEKGGMVRGDLARTVVECGWDLNELRPAAMSLEEIFLQLTGNESCNKGAATMRNAWTICRKELGSYFVSPIAYLLLTMFGLIFGFFFWNALGFFVIEGMEMQMRGQMFPMNVNEQVIRPLLQNVSVIGLFFIPMITMRLFAEEKRTGTIELLATSPIRDLEIIIGKWLAALALYSCLLLFTAVNFAYLFRYGNPDWKPLAMGYLGLLLQAGALLAIGTFISTLTKNQIIAGAATFGVELLLWVIAWVGEYESATWAQVLSYMSVITHFESFGRGVLDSKDAVFYLTLIFVGLFLTARSLESLRWRS
jgi:ABC-type multidrug transport system ATPase subunit/ABC-type transport system involved in multi-copper enzyme maturation permease subunit